MLDTDLGSGDFLSVNIFWESPLKLSHFTLFITGYNNTFLWGKIRYFDTSKLQKDKVKVISIM